MNISTPRLLIRPFQSGDINSSYLRWLNDKAVTRYSNQRFVSHTTLSSKAYLKGFAGTSNSFLLIKTCHNQKPIGTATVYRDIHHGTAQIGLLIGDRSSWGLGYGHESWQAILEALLAEPSIRKVTAGTARVNCAMVRIMEKSGMMLEAVMAFQQIIEGDAVDLLYYARFA